MRIYQLTLLAVWITLLGLLVKKNYLDAESPVFYSDLTTGISDISSDAQWMAVYHNGARMGYSIYSISNNDTAGYTIRSTTILKLAIAGMEANVTLINAARLDTSFQIRSFDYSLQSDQYTTRLKGRREGRRIRLIQIHGGDSTIQYIDAPEKVYSYIGIQPMISSRGISEGDHIRIPVFDPLTSESGMVDITHQGRETLSISGEELELNKIGIEFDGIPATLWLDDNGLTFREETVMGLVMEKSSPGEVNMWERETVSLDMFDAYAVPVDRSIRNPGLLSRLTLQINGLEPELLTALNSQRQEVIRNAPLQLRLTKQPFPDESAAADQFLQGDNVIQPFHPRIQTVMKEVIGDAGNVWEKVLRLHGFVYHLLKKQPVVSMSSAVEILQQRTGDCSEHTILFSSLSRAAGIPTKIHIGLVYINDRFAYHAWPVVLVNGQWISTDPTLDQPVADATHIAFLEGDFVNLNALIPIMGNIDIDVIDQQYESRTQ